MGQHESPRPFTPAQGRKLVRLARQTLENHFGVGPVTVLTEMEKDADFQRKQGTFVTLEIDGNLRGCIGNLGPSDSVLAGVQDNARNAAFHDFRFPQVTAAELGRITVEVSVLGQPRPLTYQDPEDLLRRLRPGIDGVILRKGSRQATFLPQVWDQLPEPADFLEHLCRKAGLPANAWQKDKLEIRTYEVQYFKESP